MIEQVRDSLKGRPIELDEEAHAAVLLALIDEGKEPCLLLTRRQTDLRNHAGEVAFPGGRRDASDATLLSTALRESEEEVGLPSHRVEPLAALPIADTMRGFRVAPFVGIVSGGFNFTLNRHEVESVFLPPLDFFLNDKNLLSDEYQSPEGARRIPRFHYRDYQIWGFTASVLACFFDLTLQTGLSERLASSPVVNYF